MPSSESMPADHPIVFLVQPGLPDADLMRQFLDAAGFDTHVLPSVQDALADAPILQPVALVAAGPEVFEPLSTISGSSRRIVYGSSQETFPEGVLAASSLEDLARILQRSSRLQHETTDVFAALQARFLQRAQQDMNRILQSLDEDHLPDDLYRIVHRWSGVGGTLGLPEVSQTAALLEDRLGQQPPPSVHEIRPGLEAIAAFFARKTERPATESPAGTLLQGQRFGLLGFTPAETERIQLLLEQARATVRVLDAHSDPNSSAIISGFDVAIVSADLGASEIEWLRPEATHRPAAVLVIGAPELVLHRIPELRAFRHDILVAPWIPEDLVFRCYRLTLPKWTPVRTPAQSRIDPLILIADDDPSLTSLIEMTLQQYHMRAVIASDGEQALRMATSFLPDLILLDAVMPRLNGFDALERLRALDETASIPIVMISACRHERDILRGLRLGANDYIVKPFHPPELMARVRRLLRKDG